MTDYTFFGRKVNSIRTDILLPNTGQLICVDQRLAEHRASGKEEIQDFVLSSSPLPATTPSIDSDGDISTAEKVERLFQNPGRRGNTFDSVGHRRSWTDSRATYQNAARREYYLLLTNPRQANHLVTVKYLEEFTAQKIRATWLLLKESLKRQGIIAFVVIEITTNPHVLPDGSRRYYPINRVHYHALVDSDLSERQLRIIFKCSCRVAGLERGEFGIMYESISDRQAFEHKCKYILKFDNFLEQAILFRPCIGISKICSIGRWFINSDGSRADKERMWKSIVAKWYAGTKQP